MINTLTSLRLFFALMVFGAHCYVVDSTFSTHFYKEGFVGVSFFFILSGFIIAYNYQQKLVERKVSQQPAGRASYWVYLRKGGLPELYNLPTVESEKQYVASVKDTILLRDISPFVI